MSGSCPTSPYPASITLRSRTRNLVNTALSGKRYSRSFGMQLWEIDAVYPPMTREQFDPIYAFALSQDGGYGTFTFSAHDRATPRGSAGGSPLVNGGSQTGTSLVTDGWPHSTTGNLLPGDIITLGGSTKVYMVMSSVDSDSSGNATISLNTNLVSSPANNAVITISGVSFTVGLSTEIEEMKVGEANIYQYTLSMVEAL